MKAKLLFGLQLLLLFVLTSCSNDDGKMSATTATGLPSLTTIPAMIEAGNIVTLGGVIEYRGYSNLINYGVCWGTQANPVMDEATVNYKLGTGDITGEFNFTLDVAFAPQTTYYARAFAKNEQGIFYAPQITFTTLGL